MAIKERPILFSGRMVLATIEDRKTQTRRLIKHGQVFRFAPGGDLSTEEKRAIYKEPFIWDKKNPAHPKMAELLKLCPYGAPGDRLWVKETWMPDAPRNGTWSDVEFYGCKNASLDLIPERYRKPKHCLYRASWDGELVGWRPSIHMPRWASRITLQIVERRAERLQDITEADAKAEGITERAAAIGRDGGVWFTENGQRFYEEIGYRVAFRQLWESINGPGSWEGEKWVWVVTYQMLNAGKVA